MNATFFDLAFYVAVPFWALMIFAPGWSVTRRIISSPLIVLPTLVVFVVLAAPHLPELWTLVSQPSLEGFQTFLREPGAAAAVWAQIIAWDLFVGRWMYLDARLRGIHPLIMGPMLVFTTLLSPFAVPLFLALRAATPNTKSSTIDDRARS